MEFGSLVMLRVTDKPQGGLMWGRWIGGVWLGSRFNTLEHLVSRRSDGGSSRVRRGHFSSICYAVETGWMWNQRICCQSILLAATRRFDSRCE